MWSLDKSWPDRQLWQQMVGKSEFRYWKRWGTWALVALGVVFVYVALCWLWHSRHLYSWIPAERLAFNFDGTPISDPFAIPDPFASSPSTPTSPDSERVLNNVLFDFSGWYRALTYPYRLRESPEGEPYFLDRRDQFNISEPDEGLTAYLRRMKEPSLLVRDPADKSHYVRLTISRAFDPALSFCLSRANDGASLRATALDGSGSDGLGEIEE